MSTTSLTAGQVMDRSASLMNDTAKTDYTYTAQLPYLNMAIDELMESLEESNNSPTNLTTSSPIVIPIGTNKITPAENPTGPHYPIDLVEIQEVGERLSGTTNVFVRMGRRDFISTGQPGTTLDFWAWEDQCITFNPNGAISVRDVQLKYIRQAVQLAINETSIIGTINARSYLAYKTAAFCAMFIGENETRAQVLDGQAEKSLERIMAISNKGRQATMTRHRPFRAAYKRRGGI